MTSACLGNFGAYKLFYWNESKKQFDFDTAEKRLHDEISLSALTKDRSDLNLSSDNLDGIERIRALKHIIFDFLGWRYQACCIGR